MSKINVVITGVGNVTKTLLKGLQFYKNSTEGLWHPKLAGFTISDIAVSGVYDVDSSKVGKKIKDIITDYKIDSDLTVQAGIADDYKVRYYPKQKPFLQELITRMEENATAGTIRSELGEFSVWYDQVKKIRTYQGSQARMPFELQIH